MTSAEAVSASAANLESKKNVFIINDNLKQIWASFTEKSDEKCFRKFVKGFVTSWEMEICPSWEMTVTMCLDTKIDLLDGELPDELLPALSKFLIIGKDDVDQGNIDAASISRSREIVTCLTITCRKVEHVPLVASMDFVRTITQMAYLLLQHLLDMESTFFMRKSKKKAEVSTRNLRDEIMAFIIASCHFLESLYDPHFLWRAYMSGKEDLAGDCLEQKSAPVALHQETIPFLYESFETALVECFPDLGLEMVTVLGAIISGKECF
jgi:hypothetical protein